MVDFIQSLGIGALFVLVLPLWRSR